MKRAAGYSSSGLHINANENASYFSSGYVLSRPRTSLAHYLHKMVCPHYPKRHLKLLRRKLLLQDVVHRGYRLSDVGRELTGLTPSRHPFLPRPGQTRVPRRVPVRQLQAA